VRAGIPSRQAKDQTILELTVTGGKLEEFHELS